MRRLARERAASIIFSQFVMETPWRGDQNRRQWLAKTDYKSGGVGNQTTVRLANCKPFLTTFPVERSRLVSRLKLIGKIVKVKLLNVPPKSSVRLVSAHALKHLLVNNRQHFNRAVPSKVVIQMISYVHPLLVTEII